MSIERKLLGSYFLSLIIPIVLVMVVFSSVTTEYWGESLNDEQRLDVYYETKFYQETKDTNLSRALEKQMIINRNELKNADYFGKLNNTIAKNDYYLAVRNNEKIIYTGINDLQVLRYSEIPPFNSDSNLHHEYNLNSNMYRIVKKMDYKIDGESNLSIFVFKKLSSLQTPLYFTFLKNLTVYTFLLVFIYSVLSLLIARSITKPLDRLILALHQLRIGNFDHEIKSTTCDKIGEVTEAFEETRKQLKDLFEKEREFETNRKETIANISHDIKTPLTSIKVHVDAINDGIANTEEKRERYLNIVYRKITDIDNMLNELNVLSNLDVRDIQLKRFEVDYNNFMNDVIDEYVYDAAKNSVNIKLNLVGDVILPVYIDIEKIKRVVINIIENSIRYGQVDDLEIIVTVTNDEAWVITQIEDNGVGLKCENYNKIFDRFYREDDSRNLEKHGSGIGLAIAKQIIVGHKGMIWADRNGKRGLKTIFKLPNIRKKDLNEKNINY